MREEAVRALEGAERVAATREGVESAEAGTAGVEAVAQAVAEREEAKRAATEAESAAAAAAEPVSGPKRAAHEDNSGREECPVCLIELAGRPKKACFPCGHVVCSPCADQHYAQFPTCPTCRFQIQHLLKLF